MFLSDATSSEIRLEDHTYQHRGVFLSIDKPSHYTHIYTHMKTTIELPDHLLHRAKTVAARRRTTLKNLMIEGLEHVIKPPQFRGLPSAESGTDAFLELDAHGVPVLRRPPGGSKPVNDRAINELREELGI